MQQAGGPEFFLKFERSGGNESAASAGLILADFDDERFRGLGMSNIRHGTALIR